MRKGSTLSYLLGDHLGSTSLTTNTSGTLVSELRYKPWGETRYTSGTIATSYQYTGQRNEVSIGLYFYNARWYDPALGRFAQADTIFPGGVQGLDRYAYVNNSPVVYVDPSGHCAVGKDGHILQKDGKIAKTDCSVDDFYKLNWGQRLEWMKLFGAEHELGNWFDDIIAAIEVMTNDPQMFHQPIYCCRLHFHFIAQFAALLFKCARGRYHARIIRDRFTHKMDSDECALCFDCTRQHFTATNLGADQFQVTIFKDADNVIRECFLSRNNMREKSLSH